MLHGRQLLMVERLDQMARQVQLVLKEPQELLEQQEQTEPRERQGQLEFLALMEQLVPREQQAYLD